MAEGAYKIWTQDGRDINNGWNTIHLRGIISRFSNLFARLVLFEFKLTIIYKSNDDNWAQISAIWAQKKNYNEIHT